ncbi:MAG: type I polyketide synthase, partial [Acidobacteriota bacterium]
RAIEAARSEPIAIVGIGCRFPGGDGPDAYWALLRDGVDAVAEVPADRWDIDAYYDADPDAPGKMNTRFGAFVAGIDRFDPQFFGISPREAASMDPQQRLVLETAWEALEHAGIDPDSLVGSDTGVFAGSSTHDYGFLHIRYGDPSAFDAYFGTGNAPNAISGRLSYVLGLQGPSVAIDTACSSSLVAVHLASQSLRAGECRIALAGGVNVILVPELTINFSRARMMAPNGRCKTFDASADGYVRGEGAGIVVLKRLSHAKADGNRILAVLRGSAVNQDGRSGGFTAPSELAQQAVIRRALALARLQPLDISYVEAHGTGTSLGDPIEVQALAAVLGPGRSADAPLYLGSAKTNFGHLEAAAGIAGLIKVTLALQHQALPAHLHFTQPNPYAPLAEIPAVVPTATIPWPASASGPRRAGVSSFGFTGTNAHLIVEEAPPVEPIASGDRPLQVVTVSGRSEEAMRASAARLAACLASEAPGPSLADVALTTTAGRSHFAHRAAMVVGSLDEARESLEAVGRVETSPRAEIGRAGAATRPDVAFLFTGQGAQYAGMGRRLYETEPAFRRTLDRCADLLGPSLSAPLLAVMHGPADTAPATLDATGFTQPALFALEYAVAELWRSWGIEPAAVIGHSVGEYAAACVAGVFSLEDGLRLIAARAGLMQQLPGGGAMAAVLASRDRVAEAIGGRRTVSIAAENGPMNTVISGPESDVEAIVADVARAGIEARRLAVSHAFHSALIDPMLAEFERVAASVTWHPPRIPIASNLTGTLVHGAEMGTPAYWRRHAREAVRFEAGIRALHAQGVRLFLEVGPTPTLTSLARRCVPEEDGCEWLASLQRGRDDWQVLLHAVARLYVRGATPDWSAFGRDAGGRRVALPTYPFQRERHWVDLPNIARAALASAPASSAGDWRAWLHQLSWPVTPVGSAAADLPAGRWLIFGDEGGLGEALARGLDASGRRAVLVNAGREYSRNGDRFSIDPASRAHLERLWAELAPEDIPDHLVHLWSLDVDAGAASPTAAAMAPCASLLHAAQAMAGADGLRRQVWVVTRGAVSAGEPHRVGVAQSAAWGLARTLMIEYPAVGWRCIDLAPAASSSDSDVLLREFRSLETESQIAFRQDRRLAARLVPAPPAACGHLTLRGDRSYLVTGAFGALGMRVARWLADRGARHLLLVGRRGVPDGARSAVTELEARGVRVTAIKADVSDGGDVARMIAAVDDRAPLAGVVHAAGVLDDGVIAQQQWSRFATVMGPKVDGAWHLHRHTSNLPLDFFVLFSSAVALLGSAGQGNYAAANACLDALAWDRKAQGLPALSVDWGPWSDAGMAAALDARSRDRFTRQGWRQIPPEAGLAALEHLIATGTTHAGVLPVDWDVALPPGAAVGIFAGLARRGEAHASRPDTASSLTVHDLAGMTADLQNRAVEAHVTSHLRRVLAVSMLDAETALGQLGLDSLMALEVRNALERELGISLPVVSLIDGSSARAVSDAVLALARDQLRDNARSPATGLPIEAAAAKALLERVDDLSDTEVDALLASLQADRHV